MPDPYYYTVRVSNSRTRPRRHCDSVHSQLQFRIIITCVLRLSLFFSLSCMYIQSSAIFDGLIRTAFWMMIRSMPSTIPPLIFVFHIIVSHCDDWNRDIYAYSYVVPSLAYLSLDPIPSSTWDNRFFVVRWTNERTNIEFKLIEDN